MKDPKRFAAQFRFTFLMTLLMVFVCLPLMLLAVFIGLTIIGLPIAFLLWGLASAIFAWPIARRTDKITAYKNSWAGKVDIKEEDIPWNLN